MLGKSKNIIRKLQITLNKLEQIEHKAHYNIGDLRFINGLMRDFKIDNDFIITKESKILIVESKETLSLDEFAKILKNMILKTLKIEADKQKKKTKINKI